MAKSFIFHTLGTALDWMEVEDVKVQLSRYFNPDFFVVEDLQRSQSETVQLVRLLMNQLKLTGHASLVNYETIHQAEKWLGESS